MPIRFSCPKCGRQFTVRDELAGKTGRCNTCQNRFHIPTPERKAAPAAVSGHFQLNGLRKGNSPEDARGGYHVPSAVKLAAVSEHSLDRIRANERRWEEDDEDSSPYNVKKERVPWAERRQARKRRRRTKAPGALKEFYWARIHGLRHLLDNLNEGGYLLSIPFIAMIIIAILWQNRSLAVTGASGVIAISIVRFYINLIHLAVVPFRQSLTQGILFFIPPITFYLIYKNWKAMKHGVHKLVGPIFQIVIIVLIFSLVPFLHSSEESRNLSLPERIRKESDALMKETKSNTEKVEDATRKAGTEAVERVRQKLDSLDTKDDSDTESDSNPPQDE